MLEAPTMKEGEIMQIMGKMDVPEKTAEENAGRVERQCRNTTLMQNRHTIRWEQDKSQQALQRMQCNA